MGFQSGMFQYRLHDMLIIFIKTLVSSFLTSVKETRTFVELVKQSTSLRVRFVRTENMSERVRQRATNSPASQQITENKPKENLEKNKHERYVLPDARRVHRSQHVSFRY